MKNLYLFVFLLVLGTNLVGQTAINFSISNATTTVGNDFSVGVYTNNFTNVAGCSFGLAWDSSMIQFDTINNLNAAMVSGAFFNMLPGTTASGQTGMGWSTASTLTLPPNTLLFNITFKALSSGVATIDFSDNLFAIQAENPLFEPIPVTTTPGNITIQQSVNTNNLLENVDIRFGPNPAREVLYYTYALEQSSPLTIEILDLHGKVIETRVLDNALNGVCTVDLTQFTPGIYFVKSTVNAGSVSKQLAITR
ncbi:MAG: T9SS type A sorting domain-containing protein [Saprospiraceae bacterium]|nr:T9SS type A sorting domain-containing protein [Saprospiraceae bacterium]